MHEKRQKKKVTKVFLLCNQSTFLLLTPHFSISMQVSKSTWESTQQTEFGILFIKK